MTNARVRRADRRAAQRTFHLRRLNEAPTLVEKADAAYNLFRSDLVNTSAPTRAEQVGWRVVRALIKESEKIPRRADRRAGQRAFHLDRLNKALTLVEKADAAYNLFRADLINTCDLRKAEDVGWRVVKYLSNQSEKIPRGPQ